MFVPLYNKNKKIINSGGFIYRRQVNMIHKLNSEISMIKLKCRTSNIHLVAKRYEEISDILALAWVQGVAKANKQFRIITGAI